MSAPRGLGDRDESRDRVRLQQVVVVHEQEVLAAGVSGGVVGAAPG